MSKRGFADKPVKPVTLAEQEEKPEVKSVSLRYCPVSYSDRFLELKRQGLVNGSFNTYILMAIMNQLREDESRIK